MNDTTELIEVLGDIHHELQRIANHLEDSRTAEWQRTPDGQPICPKHGEAMVQREKQGDTWHSHSVIDPNTGEKLYCRGYPTKNGPGWFIDHPAQPAPQQRRPLPPQQPPAQRGPMLSQRPVTRQPEVRPSPPATYSDVNDELF